MTVEQVCQSTLHYRQYYDDTYGQDIDWSEDLLAASCSTELRDAVMENMQDHSLHEQGGPLFFKYMMDLITTISDETIESLIHTVRKVTLKDDAFPGEDVEALNSLLRGALFRLEQPGVNAVPHDMFAIICRIYQTASSSEFVDQFRYVHNNKKHNVGTTLSLQALMKLVHRHYSAWLKQGASLSTRMVSYCGYLMVDKLL